MPWRQFLYSTVVFATVSQAPFAMAQDDDVDEFAVADFDGNAGAVIINALKLVNYQDLYFGTIAPNLTETGTVKVNRGRNNDSVCGTTLTCLEPGTRARYKIYGEPYYYTTLTDPGSIQISNSDGHEMTVDTFFGAGSGNNSSWRGWMRINHRGVTGFNVGAVLHVGANQSPGDYVGTFTLTAEYQ